MILRNCYFIVFAIVFLMMFMGKVQAQMWIGAIPMHYNPSFAGAGKVPRLAFFGGHLQYGQETVLSMRGSSDLYLEQVNTGAGLVIGSNTFSRVEADSVVINTVQLLAELSIAPKFSIKGKYTLSPGLAVGFIQGYKLEGHPYHFYPRASMMVSSKRSFAGVSAGYITYNGRLNDVNLVFGHVFQVSDDAKYAFAPQVLLTNGHSPVMVNLNFRRARFISGLGYEWDRHFMVMAGFQSAQFRVFGTMGIRGQSMTSSVVVRWLFTDR